MGAELRRVLLVDDDPGILAMAQLSLTAVGGFDVALCASGAEALERIQGFSPDLVLLDATMPEMDGPTTLGRLFQLPCARNLPFVFITANTQPHEVQAFLALGAVGVVPKPFDPMTLPATLTGIWNRHHG